MKQRLKWAFGRQFARPHGLFGRVAARIMRQGNAPLNQWIIDLLKVQPDNRILEVGFGPGAALVELLERAPEGAVAGVDASASMVDRARRRHRRAIAEGRLEIYQGDAASLPFDDATFDSVCGTHVIYFWPDPVVVLRELRRVLKMGGLLALGYQDRNHMPPRAVEGLTGAGARLMGPGDVEGLLREAGFADVRLEVMPGDAGPAGFCVLATK